MNCSYSLEPPFRSGSNEYSKCIFGSENKDIITHYQPKIDILGGMKASTMIHRYVITMMNLRQCQELLKSRAFSTLVAPLQDILSNNVPFPNFYQINTKRF